MQKILLSLAFLILSVVAITSLFVFQFLVWLHGISDAYKSIGLVKDILL